MSVFDGLRVGDAKNFKTDDAGGIVCQVYGDDEDKPECEDALLAQPPGFRSRLLDDPEGYDVVYGQLGDEIQVLAIANGEATAALGEIPSGATQIHSLGKKPQMVQITDQEIALGTQAKEAALLGDTFVAANSTVWDAVSKSLVIVTAAATTAQGASKDAGSIAFFKDVAIEFLKITNAIGKYTGDKAKYTSTVNKLQ